MYLNLIKSTPRKNVCACVYYKKCGEFKCQILNKNMAIQLFKVSETTGSLYINKKFSNI
jgi:hypothetical protein